MDIIEEAGIRILIPRGSSVPLVVVILHPLSSHLIVELLPLLGAQSAVIMTVPMGL